MAIIKIKSSLVIIIIVCLISACSTGTGRYQQKHDSKPNRLPNSSELHDATPRAEAHSRGGNKNYQVRGKHYHVLKSAQNFTESGIASWYGRKFHGHLTSNGEIYDMYAMSAAHKNLPLPTYLKVVNNDNNLSVIVRVNDRGPFHQSRIIDLSYSAAYKLDMLKTGTANVTITAITDFSANGLAKLNGNSINSSATKIKTATKPSLPLTPALASVNENIATDTKTTADVSKPAALPSASLTANNGNSHPHYIQVFASKSHTQADKLANALAKRHQENTQLEQINGIFRVLIGPIKQRDEITNLLLSIKDNGYPNAFIRKLN